MLMVHDMDSSSLMLCENIRDDPPIVSCVVMTYNMSVPHLKPILICL